jgi:hypothetical protein
MRPDRRMMKCRVDAANMLQKLIFRAQQKNGFVSTDDCMAVTDMITISVIESFAQYMNLEEEQKNELISH